jgi:hypothetical protein
VFLIVTQIGEHLIEVLMSLIDHDGAEELKVGFLGRLLKNTGFTDKRL